MPLFQQNLAQGPWLRWWLTTSFAIMFSGIFLFDSHTALLNVLDVLFFLPSLTLVTRALVSGDHRLLTAPLMIPLYLFLAWALLSMSWAEQPNVSRTVRGVVQLLVMVGLFRWLHLYFRHTFKQALANGALTAMIVATAVMVSYYTTQPLSSPLFSEPANLIFRLPYLQTLEALMIVVAPTFILLSQALEEGPGAKGARRMAGTLVGLTFLCLTSLPLGLMCLLLAIGWICARTRRPWMAILPLLAAFYVLLDHTSLGTVGNYLLHPWVGNGLNQETLNGVIARDGNQLLSLAHPNNLYLLMIHSVGLVGLLLFMAAWLVPTLALVRQKIDWRHDTACTVAAIPGLMMVFAAGAYLMVPFHASWVCIWIPLALLLARQSERQTIQPPQRAS